MPLHIRPLLLLLIMPARFNPVAARLHKPPTLPLLWYNAGKIILECPLPGIVHLPT